MKAGFNGRGDAYILEEKRTAFPLYNYHFNKEYHSTIANDMTGDGHALIPSEKTFTRNFRYAIVKDGTSVWSLGGNGENGDVVDSFTCEYKMASTTLTGVKDGLKLSAEFFVPNKGLGEYLIYKVKNQTASDKKISLVVVNSLEWAPMGPKCEADLDGNLIYSHVTPYYIYYNDQAKIDKLYNVCYTVTSARPDRVCCGEFPLFNGTHHDLKKAVEFKDQRIMQWGNPVSAFGYDVLLKAGEEKTFWTFTGVCLDKNSAIEKAKTLLKGDAGKELKKAEDYYNGIAGEKLTNSGDVNIDNFASFWQRKQILFMGVTRKGSTNYCVRNCLQDAMGLAYVDKKWSKEYFIEIIGQQKKDGSLKQHGLWDDKYTPTGLGLLYMRDGPSWLVICVTNYILDSGDYDFLKEVVKYRDSGKDTVLNHLNNAVEFMWKDRGMYGLSLLGDGDWTDPINGPGRGGKGVSTWTSMAFTYGLRNMQKIYNKLNLSDAELVKKIDTMDKAIVDACFKDDRFIAGYNDDGIPYGCKDDKEGSLFLNMQSWAIISGVAKGEILNKCVENIEKLRMPFGIKVMTPSFSDWNGKFGKISVKRAGGTENGSMYCHACMFAIYALYLAGKDQEAKEILASVLPTHDYKADFETQPPIFIPNFYFGEKTPEYGRSSAVISTGSVAWFLKIYNEMFVK